MDIRSFFSPKCKTAKLGASKEEEKRASNGTRSSSKIDFIGSKTKSKVKKLSSSDDDEVGKKAKKYNKSHKKKVKNLVESDSDEDPLPPNIRKVTSQKGGNKVKKKSKRSNVLEESDEEEVVPHKLKKSEPEKKKVKDVVIKESPVKQKETPQKATSAVDFFGSSPIERSSRKVFATKRKEREDDGDDPEITSTKLDNAQNRIRTKQKEASEKMVEQPSKKLKESSSISSLRDRKPSPNKKKTPEKMQDVTPASKLAAKAAEAKTAIPETPVREAARTPKKSVTPFHDEQVKKESPCKNTPKTNKTQEHDEVPPSLEKKRSGYRSFMAREGPRALGSKSIPQGEENCLEGLTFVITGVLESIERDETTDLIQRYGGKVTQSISKKTSYIVVGRDAGESKLSKAKQLGTTQVDEDGLFELVRTRPGKKTSYEPSNVQSKPNKKAKVSVANTEPSSQGKNDSVPATEPSSQGKNEFESEASQRSDLSVSSPATQTPSSSPVVKGEAASLLWVDKYRPRALKQIIGQQGDKSNMRKLMSWLRDWEKNRKKPPSKVSFFKKDQDGSSLRAALLSGSPGVGKTTTATLVCEELGFSYIEMNASDTRNKRTLEEQISQSLNNKTMDGYIPGNKSDPRKHVLIMDEVDGMAGNEDRGGMQELISLIKNTKIPIICMCNDRNSQKIRSLANYCFDLRFQRPRVEQIKGAMMSIAFKEGLKIPPQAMEQIIVGANQDVRQVLHNLSMWTSKEKSINYDQAKKESEMARKDIKMGAFDAVRKLLSGAESSKMNLNEKSDMFFCDYSLMPLFVQENYLLVEPYKAGSNVKKALALLSETAEAICDGDLMEKQIRQRGNWSLLPMQAIFSCVIPSNLTSGGLGQRIEFPQWLGKNSKFGRLDRILQELQGHMRLSTSSSKRSINLDYLPHIRQVLTRPLMTQESDEISLGVKRVLQVMEEYDLTKEDWEAIVEVGQFEGRGDPISAIPSKVKAAFTRTYNKESHRTPYAIRAAPKKGRRGAGIEESQEFHEADEQLDEAGSEDDGVENDAMIRAKKKPATTGKGRRGKAGKEDAVSQESTRGKGKGKGKNRK